METPVYSVKGHSEIINCIDGVGGLGIGEGAPEIVTGSRDGNNYTHIPFFDNREWNQSYGIKHMCTMHKNNIYLLIIYTVCNLKLKFQMKYFLEIYGPFWSEP